MKQVATLYLIILFSASFYSQHPYFGSLNQQLLSTNPAFAGSSKNLRVQTYYQNLYPNLSGTYVSYYAGADKLFGKRNGVGLNVFTNDIEKGTLKQTQVNLSYAYHIIVKEKIKIVPAIQISYFQYNLDRSKLNFNSPLITPWSGPNIPAQSKYNFDISAGFLAYEKNYYFGASVLTLTMPDEGLLGVSKRPMTQIFQAGYNLELNEKMIFSPYAFIKLHKGNDFTQAGAYLTCNKIKFHLAYRRSDDSYANSYIAGFNYNLRVLRIGYNTIINNSAYGSLIYSHEIYFSVNLANKIKTEEEKAKDTAVRLMD